MTPRQLLTRYSFQSLFRSEALSESGVDAYRAWLISIAIALVCFHLHLARILAIKYGAIAAAKNEKLFRSAVTADELFYLAAGFLFVLLLATLQWQALFPSERDHQVLSTLPIRRADIFLSRLTALTLFLSLFLAAFSLPPALLFPGFARGPFPLEPVSQRLFAHLASGLGAGLHAFLSVLALQGLCLTLLPHRLRSAASFTIQSGLLTLTIACIPIAWHIPGLYRLLDTRADWLTWLPPVWWLGVCETLRGSPDPWFHALSNTALTATAASAFLAAAAYLHLYRRFSDFAAPPRTPSPRQSPLLQLARRDDSAALAFIATTLARSAQHRLILSAIAAVGAALALDGFLSTYIRQWTRGRASGGLFLETSLALPLLLTFSLTAALRMSFRIPHEWRAHWIFRFTEYAPARPAQLEASLTAMYLFAVIPAMAIALPFQLAALGPAKTLAALPVLLLLNAALVEYTLHDSQRLPFTATYAPSHRPAAISLVFFLSAFSIYGYGNAALIKHLIGNPLHWLGAVAALSALWGFLRRKRLSHWGDEPFVFHDDGAPTVQITGFAPE